MAKAKQPDKRSPDSSSTPSSPQSASPEAPVQATPKLRARKAAANPQPEALSEPLPESPIEAPIEVTAPVVADADATAIDAGAAAATAAAASDVTSDSTIDAASAKKSDSKKSSGALRAPKLVTALASKRNQALNVPVAPAPEPVAAAPEPAPAQKPKAKSASRTKKKPGAAELTPAELGMAAPATPRRKAKPAEPVAPVPVAPPRLVKNKSGRPAKPAGEMRAHAPIASTPPVMAEAHDSAVLDIPATDVAAIDRAERETPVSVVVAPDAAIVAADAAAAETPAQPAAVTSVPNEPVAEAIEAPVVVDTPVVMIDPPPAPKKSSAFDPLAAIEARIASAPKFVLAEPATVVVREGVEFQGVPSLETAIAGVPPPKPVVARVATANDSASKPAERESASLSGANLAEASQSEASRSDVIGTIAPRATSDAGSGERTFEILMVASEAVGFAKTGGLADVAGALPVALGKLGHRVTIVLPRYRGIEVSGKPVVDRLTVELGGEPHTVSIYERALGANARAWLIDEPALFDRAGGLYNIDGRDYPDNPRRFALLTRAALEGARAAGLTPDVVHTHDWQGGLAPVYLKTRFAHDPVLGGVPSVFTIHNMAYQGRCDPSWIPQLDLGWDLFRPEALEFWHQISLLKAGVVFADKVTTVSPRYAQEILTPEFGEGFEGVLAGRRGDLVGILNGIDEGVWNPATDPKIPQPYSVDDLSGKRAAKRALLQAYGLPSDEEALGVPVIGMVSRMVDQKGLDLIEQIAAELPHLDARIVILGTGEPRYQEMWRALSAAHPDRISAKIGFDEDLSHLLEAGADLFLMPSRFEPCGLNQMYSQRYGTLPLVRATGGLDDTVDNYDPYRESGSGFKFWDASGHALLNTLRWALQVYEAPDVWRRLQREAMQRDFSWNRSARDYAALYGQLVPAERVQQA